MYENTAESKLGPLAPTITRPLSNQIEKNVTSKSVWLYCDAVQGRTGRSIIMTISSRPEK